MILGWSRLSCDWQPVSRRIFFIVFYNQKYTQVNTCISIFLSGILLFTFFISTGINKSYIDPFLWMDSYQLIFPIMFSFFFLCFVQTNGDGIVIHRWNKQVLIGHEQVFGDEFQFRQVLPVLLPQRIVRKSRAGIEAAKDLLSTKIPLTIPNYQPPSTANTCNTTLNRKFQNMSDIAKNCNKFRYS